MVNVVELSQFILVTRQCQRVTILIVAIKSLFIYDVEVATVHQSTRACVNSLYYYLYVRVCIPGRST